MAHLTIIIDGIENGEYTYCPSLRGAAPTGFSNNTPSGMEADSLNCIMHMLGVPPGRIPAGRACLEALAAGLDLSEDDIVFRGNKAVIDSLGTLVSSCGCGVPVETNDERAVIKHIGGHKYLMAVKGGKRYFDGITTYPPHQHIGERLDTIRPAVPRELCGLFNTLVDEYNILPWGQSYSQPVPSFAQLNGGKTAAVVAKTEIVVGMAKAMCMYCPPLKRATADTDTDLGEKASVAIELCGSFDFVMLHINGADECAHRLDAAGKHSFIEEIDLKVIGFVMNNARGPLSVTITADHETSAETGRHINSAVSYYTIDI